MNFTKNIISSVTSFPFLPRIFNYTFSYILHARSLLYSNIQSNLHIITLYQRMQKILYDNKIIFNSESIFLFISTYIYV